MGPRLLTLRWVNVGFANLLICAHAGLLAYLVAAWSAAGWLAPGARGGLWFVLAVVETSLAIVGGVALGLLVWTLNRLALRALEPAVRDRWARRLGIVAFAAVALGGTVGAVELFIHRPPMASDAL